MSIKKENFDDKNGGMGQNRTWGGRFQNGPENSVAQYTDSQHYDRAMYEQDILASVAHARMLEKQAIITKDEADAIVEGLHAIQEEIRLGKFVWKQELEDLHMNIEARLVELVGKAGKKLHTGRSRNDQVGLTFRLFVNDCCQKWQRNCVRLITSLYRCASSNMNTILPGFTHLQPAQPVSLAHHLLAYAGMFKRDYDRLNDAVQRIKISPLGAAALAGSTFPLDPEYVCDIVGFNGIYANSMDAVSDRDFVIESLFCASAIMMHLSRLCEEIIIWANPAFGFVKLPDSYSTGSSIMPQKKNPDVAELMRGKCGRVYGDLFSMLTTMKGLPLAYNRDLQEDKECFLDADKTVSDSLAIMAEMLPELGFQKEKMLSACKSGFLNATEMADYLARKNIPFRDAHHITGQIVAYAEKQGRGLEDLDLKELKSFSEAIERDVFESLDYKNAVTRRETPGGTGPVSVERQLSDLKDWLDSNRHIIKQAGQNL